MTKKVRDYDKGWVTVEYADKLAEIAREQGHIQQHVLRQYMQIRARNIIEISKAVMQRRALDEAFDFDTTKEEITQELIEVQRRYDQEGVYCRRFGEAWLALGGPCRA